MLQTELLACYSFLIRNVPLKLQSLQKLLNNKCYRIYFISLVATATCQGFVHLFWVATGVLRRDYRHDRTYKPGGPNTELENVKQCERVVQAPNPAWDSARANSHQNLARGFRCAERLSVAVTFAARRNCCLQQAQVDGILRLFCTIRESKFLCLRNLRRIRGIGVVGDDLLCS